ncbi:HAD family hydrolase [Candidatus Pacearchaeota archaeon]|nr:HAD family hydrolase [Candidatus Pacearchaeota archaeon]
MIKLVIFDLDDCLLDTWASFSITIRAAINAMVDAGLKIHSFDEAVNRLEEINNKSKNCPEAITRYLNEIGADAIKYMEVGKRAIYDFNFDNRIKPNSGVVEMLEKLYPLNIDLAIVTRGGKERQMKRMEIAGIDKTKFKIISAVANYDKTESYQRIMEELGHSAENTLVVGDRYETDLIPGKKLGTKVAWVPKGRGNINPPKKEDVDYVIEDFREILEIVED